jgi:hypothetical protein
LSRSRAGESGVDEFDHPTPALLTFTLFPATKTAINSKSLLMMVGFKMVMVFVVVVLVFETNLNAGRNVCGTCSWG